MTPRGKRELSFALATAVIAPFALVLLLSALAATVPGLTASQWLSHPLLIAYYVVPSPAGLGATAIAVIALGIAFRNRTDSRAAFYALIGYGAVLLCYVAYITWWYATDQKLDSF